MYIIPIIMLRKHKNKKNTSILHKSSIILPGEHNIIQYNKSTTCQGIEFFLNNEKKIEFCYYNSECREIYEGIIFLI